MMTKRLLWITLAGFCLSGTGCKKEKEAKEKPAPAAEIAVGEKPPATPVEITPDDETEEHSEPEEVTERKETPPANTASVKPVIFMAYNVRNYLRMDRREGTNAPKPEREIQALVDEIARVKPDILGICEIGSDEDVADLQRRLMERGMLLTESEISGGADPVRRLALLSRYPISARQSQRELYYRLQDNTMPYSRGVLDATVWISPTYQVRFMGTHLKSKREVPEAPQELMRAGEAQLLRDHLNVVLRRNPSQNLLVYGDFNDDKHTLPVKIIKGSFATPLWMEPIELKDDRGEVWTHYWVTADSYSRLDYAFASKGLRREILTEQSYIPSNPAFYDASDHRPLVIAIHPENFEN